ncbi:N-acetyl-gamma-glutamyl-phosphate reductase [Botrimarina hoheduenensis]|uniref:N-acetyl-gamma-glutamyl-phosphate reductase n=1 Tax=Botrimarina hoheduenensis TaxID=2528000 RepID=A0A5C5WF05_9BACT|nr:N-acetyl-gamma-glutamyl-phosphate reductase [Botrimarina hoheduenensis]TWT48671.1 N-acetyl-gamma-glutamyl-phosphate reductase [Botrimarina hoheduenensis]
MLRVAVYGASGYTGLELLKLLARHPHAQVTAVTTRQEDTPTLEQVHPQLTGLFDLWLEQLTADEVAQRADVAFTCLPHAASAEVVKELVDRGLRVIDLSADYRLTDRAIYEHWYGVTHPDPERLTTTPYGLPELFREEIRGAKLVANPGCYPTAAILGLAPLLRAGLIETSGIVIDAKSGVSGAGRNPKQHLHFPECNENLSPYGVGTHRHMPEIDQVLSRVAGGRSGAVEVVFTPHLVPMDRGEMCTSYALPAADVTTESLNAALHAAYDNEPFISVVQTPPGTKDVAHSNRCHVYTRLVRGRVIVVSVIDNLIKGASGAAIQNFNLMHGLDETIALR